MFISKLNKFFHIYDPYGELRVFAFQGVYLMTSLFLINLFFGPYKFNSAMNIPICAFYVCGLEPNLNKRLLNMALYSVINIAYVIILSFAWTNRFLIVFSVGIMVFSLFMLGKNRLPIVLVMVPLISALAFSQVIPFSGDVNVIMNYCFSYLITAILGIAIIYFFPRRYFFNVWINILAAAIAEFKLALIKISNKDFDFSQIKFNDQYTLQTWSLSLESKTNGFIARKLSLILINIYSFLTVLLNRIDEVDNKYLLELIQLCSLLEQAIRSKHDLNKFIFTQSDNIYISKAQSDFNRIIINWNSLCSKI